MLALGFPVMRAMSSSDSPSSFLSSRNQYKDYSLTDTQSYLVYLGQDENGYHFIDTSFKDNNIVYVEKSEVKTNHYDVIKSLKPKDVCIGQYEDNDKWEILNVKAFKLK